MNQLSELSAAPHLPYALRPESLVYALNTAADDGSPVCVKERDGEIYIDFATE